MQHPLKAINSGVAGNAQYLRLMRERDRLPTLDL